MSETLLYIENKIREFSFEEQLSLLSYLTEALNKNAAARIPDEKPFSRPLGGLEEGFFMAEDFDDTPDCFKEYM